MKKFYVIPILVLVALFSYLPHPYAATISLKFATFFPPVAPQSKLWNDFCEEVQKRTNGAGLFATMRSNPFQPIMPDPITETSAKALIATG